MYENSPKVKCREGMYDVFQLIAELNIPSRDRVSISPRSCVDFVRCAHRFRQVINWGTLEIGSDLKNLRRGGELLERENITKKDDMNRRGVVE